MLQTAILQPVFVQVLLTLIVLFTMLPMRSRSMRDAGETLHDANVRLGTNAWSEQATKVSNSYRNQFELPVLFYAVAAFSMLTRSVDIFMLILAWVFVVSRIVHAGVHIGPNVITWRGPIFAIGVFTLLIMWILLAVRVLGGV